MTDPVIDFESFPEFPQPQEKPAEPSAPVVATPEPTPAASTDPSTVELPTEADAAPIEIENTPAEVPESVIQDAPEVNGTAIEIENDDSSSPAASPASEKNESRSSALMQSAHNTFENVRGRIKSLQTRATKRESQLVRIMDYARTRSSIRNDDIEKLLHVSDNSATRYLNMLVQRGQLSRSGKGRTVRYTLRG